MCFERHGLEHLVVLGADELAICRGRHEAATHVGWLSVTIGSGSSWGTRGEDQPQPKGSAGP